MFHYNKWRIFTAVYGRALNILTLSLNLPERSGVRQLMDRPRSQHFKRGWGGSLYPGSPDCIGGY